MKIFLSYYIKTEPIENKEVFKLGFLVLFRTARKMLE